MNFQIQFHRPESLKDPMPKYMELIKGLHKAIGKEQLSNRIESISLDWAMQSGYYFRNINGTMTFIHVSLNEKDFIPK